LDVARVADIHGFTITITWDLRLRCEFGGRLRSTL